MKLEQCLLITSRQEPFFTYTGLAEYEIDCSKPMAKKQVEELNATTNKYPIAQTVLNQYR